MVSLKRSHFLYIIVFSSPAVVRILVGRIDLCFLTHIKKYMTPIHALTFEKHVNMYVYIRQIKMPVYLEKYMQQKELAGRSFYSKLKLAGSGPGHVSPIEVQGQRPQAVFSSCSEGLIV